MKQLYIFIFLCVNVFAQDDNSKISLVPLPDDPLLKSNVQAIEFCPSNPDLAAFQRQQQDVVKLYVYNMAAGRAVHITAMNLKPELQNSDPIDSFFGAMDFKTEYSQFEGDLQWRPILDARRRQWFVFVSSGPDQSWDLYLSYIDEDGHVPRDPIRIEHKGAEVFPRWSPDGHSIVLVSGGQDGSDLFLWDNVDEVINLRHANPRYTRITQSPGMELYPAWSPDGRYLAFQATADEEGYINAGINVLDMNVVKIAAQQRNIARAVRVTGHLAQFDEYKPTWSPDGQYIAFYQLNKNVISDTSQQQDIGVTYLVKNARNGKIERGSPVPNTLSTKPVEKIKPEESKGPTWATLGYSENGLPRQSLLFIKSDADQGNPICMFPFYKWIQRERVKAVPLTSALNTHLHESLAFQKIRQGYQLGFVAHHGKSNRFYLARLFSNITHSVTIPVEKDPNTALIKSLIPGMGQMYKGQTAKGWLFAAATGVSAVLAVTSYGQYNSTASDANDARDRYQTLNEAISLGNKSYTSRNKLFTPYNEWESAYHDFDEGKKTQGHVFLALAIGVYAYNLFDAMQGFPLVQQEPVNMSHRGLQLRPDARIERFQGESHIQLGLNLSF